MKPVERTFQGERLRQARLSANFTATDLADRLEVSRQLISAAEKGKPLGKIQQALDALVARAYRTEDLPRES